MCKDTGILTEGVFHTFCGLIGPSYCRCARGREALRVWMGTAEVQEAIRERRRKQVEEALRFCNLPAKWREKTLANLDGQERLKRFLQEYVDNFGKLRQQGCGIYLWCKGSGRGKTHILSTLCQMLVERYVVPCIFMTEGEMLQRIRACYRDPDVAEEVVSGKFYTVDCLFLDDFGMEVSYWSYKKLTALLDYRRNHALPTFFTSNFALDEYERFIRSHAPRPERITARIAEICHGHIFEIVGEKRYKAISRQI